MCEFEIKILTQWWRNDSQTVHSTDFSEFKVFSTHLVFEERGARNSWKCVWDFSWYLYLDFSYILSVAVQTTPVWVSFSAKMISDFCWFPLISTDFSTRFHLLQAHWWKVCNSCLKSIIGNQRRLEGLFAIICVRFWIVASQRTPRPVRFQVLTDSIDSTGPKVVTMSTRI